SWGASGSGDVVAPFENQRSNRSGNRHSRLDKKRQLGHIMKTKISKVTLSVKISTYRVASQTR
ncbi:hypothetical protein VCX68_22350, partial [Aeromonas caviae]|uniref:hypothetical protein n=2 Tax=Aeromonas caviae TaxID=648 RepID=UPI002B24EB3F